MSEPSTAQRQAFPGIAPTSWEHPADRAALQTLRALPGFDQALKKSIGALGERGIRMMFQGNAVQVGPRQFPKIHRLQREVQATLDWTCEVPVFVSQHPWFNAGAYGVDRPFVVLNSVAVDLLDEPELRALLGHELGHVISGHALYRTMLAILLAFGLHNLPFLTGFALLPIRLALQEWSRKSELSSDRAALLCCQNPDDVIRMFLKASGGTLKNQGELDLDAYKEQISTYETNDNVDAVFKLLNLLDQSHPFHTLRAAALERWSRSEEYARILAGEYRPRGERQTVSSYGADFSDAASYYATQAMQRASELSQIARDVASQTGELALRAARDARETVKQAAEEAAMKVSAAMATRAAPRSHRPGQDPAASEEAAPRTPPGPDGRP